MGKTFRETLNEQLKTNENFRKEYDALTPEFEIVKAIIESRRAKCLTQKQLAERTGINQADISKIERGSANPSIKTLKRLAEAMDMTVHIEFVPKSS